MCASSGRWGYGFASFQAYYGARYTRPIQHILQIEAKVVRKHGTKDDPDSPSLVRFGDGGRGRSGSGEPHVRFRRRSRRQTGPGRRSARFAQCHAGLPERKGRRIRRRRGRSAGSPAEAAGSSGPDRHPQRRDFGQPEQARHARARHVPHRQQYDHRRAHRLDVVRRVRHGPEPDQRHEPGNRRPRVRHEGFARRPRAGQGRIRGAGTDRRAEGRRGPAGRQRRPGPGQPIPIDLQQPVFRRAAARRPAAGGRRAGQRRHGRSDGRRFGSCGRPGGSRGCAERGQRRKRRRRRFRQRR